MRLFLIRHAHALAHENDARRPLSERGIDTTKKVAAFFKTNGRLNPRQFWHSPLQRSFETAADLVSEMQLDSALVETDGLAPFDDPMIMAERLRIYPTDHDLAIVGHQPHLANLASLLVTSRASPALFHFKKSSVLALRLSNEQHANTGLSRWRVAWHYSPELLPEPPVTGGPL